MTDDEPGLDAERQRMRAFLRAGSISMTYMARDGTILEINEVGLQRLGLPRDQVLQRSVFELIPSMASEVRARLEHVFETKTGLTANDDVELSTGVLHFKSSVDPVFDDAGEVIAMLVQSVEATEEHATAQSLVRANEKLSLIFEHSPYLIVTYTRGGIITYINRVGPGFTLEQVVGTDSRFFVKPEFHARYDEVLGLLFDEGKSSRFEFEDVNGTWWEATLVPVKHDDHVEQAISFSVDITEKRRAEEEQARIREQLRHTQKLESLGVLAGGIAHDFNNLLLVIAANTDLAQRAMGPQHAANDYLNDVLSATMTAADLCRQMLAYAGRGQFVVERLDLSRLVAEMTQLLTVSMSKGAHVTRDLAPDLPAVKGDASQLRQVVLNLLTNASDAIGPRQGAIMVRTRRVRLDGHALPHGELSSPPEAGEYVLLEVEDTGGGIDEATRARMFEPFFSTKQSGRGLGLSATLGIIRQHRGAIAVHSTPGVGTKISVFCPAVEGASPHAVPDTPTEIVNGRGLILVVDDEERVRTVAVRALAQAGYEVITANDGRDALACYDRERDRVRLVLLDLTMPELSGQETLEALRKRDPGLPSIIMSGYTSSSLQASSDVRFLAKPFRATELVAMVGDVLKDRAGSEVEPSAPSR